jgi:hypothetical protein
MLNRFPIFPYTHFGSERNKSGYEAAVAARHIPLGVVFHIGFNNVVTYEQDARCAIRCRGQGRQVY